MLAVIGGGAVYLYIENQNKAAAQASEQARRLIDVSEIDIQDARLALNPYSSKLTGRIKNNSSRSIKKVGLKITVSDCPLNAEEFDDLPTVDGGTVGNKCDTVGQADANIYITIPPGQVRGFDEYVSFRDMPPIKGVFRWYYTIGYIEAAHSELSENADTLMGGAPSYGTPAPQLSPENQAQAEEDNPFADLIPPPASEPNASPMPNSLNK